MPTDLPPGYTGQGPRRQSNTLSGLLGLLIICATIITVVWLVTR